MHITRRKTIQFLALGGLLGATQATTRAGVPPQPEQLSSFPWQPHPLNIEKAKNIAYQGYYKGGCCYGAFDALLGQLAARYGAPYDSFPIKMMTYGKSGVAGFGTLCGTLNGTAAAFGLLFEHKVRDNLISQLFNWYAATALPCYTPKNPKLAAEIVKTRADSMLCHVSATLWCEAAGKKPSGPERKERCARLTADVAGKAVLILNEHLDGLVSTADPNDSADQCLECHAKGKDAEISQGTMNCTPCHGSKPLHRHILKKIMPVKKKLGML